MPRVIWSTAAIQDISRLHRFLAPKNPPAARRAVAAIRRGVSLLADHPEAGRPVPDMPPDFREWRIEFGAGGYVALYRYDGELAVIVAVRHARETGY